jgi:methionyl-tRNA formyltransferase
MKTIFLGTAWESLATLKVLHEDPSLEVVCVITSADKKVGRKQILTPSNVKKYSLEKKIPVVHTVKKKENYLKVLKKYKPEIAVCKAFGEIIPKEFLDFPKHGCINIHFSILPKYRGAVPIQKAILEGDKETGISIMLMNEGLDEGDILKIFKEKIRPNDTNISLRKRLVKKSTEILIPTLKKWIEGEITPTPQNNHEATYCWENDISKEKAEIIWGKHPPEYIERMIRAFIPWPVAWTRLNDNLPDSIAGKRMKIFEAELVELENEKDPGELFSRDRMVLFSTNNPFVVIRIKSFQIAGKTKTNEKQFLNGLKGSL